MKTFSAIFMSALMVTACGSLLPKGPPAPRLYTVNALVSPPAPTEAKAEIPYSLKILKPQTAPGLETERIALRKDNNQIDYFADTRWASDAPAMIQASLVESFEAARRLHSVSNDLVVLRSDYNLLIELCDFQVDYTGPQMTGAHVRMTAKLINAATDEIVKTNQYERIEPVKGSDLNAIVAAFDKAQQGVAQAMVADTLADLKGEAGKPPIPTKTQ